MIVLTFLARKLVDVISVNLIGVAIGTVTWTCAINVFGVEATFDSYCSFVGAHCAAAAFAWMFARHRDRNR
jgi:hypothetical protein